MFRSIRAAMAKQRHSKTRANARRPFLESLEQRRLLSVSNASGLAENGVDMTAAIYGPVQVESQATAARRLQPEGEGAQSAAGGARQLLFAGVAGTTTSPTNSGLLTILNIPTDSSTNSIVPWKTPALPGGIAGLAFDLTGRLFATVDQGPCTTSELVELNPASGQEIRRLRIMFGATEINIGDLAVEPSTGRMFGTRSIRDDANHAGELFVIDVSSGAATFVGDTGAGAGEGLAFAADGALYVAGADGGTPVLYKIDPATAEPHQRDAITGRAVPFVVLNNTAGLKLIEGLAGHPNDGTLIATASMTRFDGNQIVEDVYVIDVNSGSVTAQPLASPARGIFGDLAFQPSPRTLDIVYEEHFESGLDGFVTDNTGGTLPGLWHSSLGRRFDGLPSHTPIGSAYYGAFETAFGEGNYVLPLDHEGRLTSPVLPLLPASSVLSFNYLLDTRPELNVDFVTVSVIAADGTVTEILSRADRTLPQTGRQQWRTATADLSAFACQAIQLQFLFDTGPVPQIDPEGWYIDDLLIASTGGGCDFGDAPDDPTNPGDFPTLLASDGARHGIVPDFHLGSVIDAELDGQPTAMADGDDNNPPLSANDEDSVAVVTLVPGGQGSVQVELTNTAGLDAFLDAWIDYNQDGDWMDAGEHVLAGRSITAGSNLLDIDVPPNARAGDTIARFRLSSIGNLPTTGLAPDGEVEDHKVTIEEADPRIVITKMGTFNDEDGDSFAIAGETIGYTFEVSNDGNVPLGNVAVMDTMVTNIAFDGGDANANGLLDLDETWMYSGSYRLTQDDIDAAKKENTGVANATDPNGNPVSDDDTITTPVPVGENAISIIKTGMFVDANDSQLADAGETIRYTFEVHNDGSQTLSNVMVSDSMVTDITFDGGDTNMNGRLDLAETWIYSGTYELTQTDIDAGEKQNTAVVTATDPPGNPVRGEGMEVTPLPVLAKISIVKSGVFNDADNSQFAEVGETIRYAFEVNNEGNQTLSNVMLSDAMVANITFDGGDENTNGRLDVGETWTYSGTYALTQADIDAAQKLNTATATALDPSGNPVSDTDMLTIPFPVESVRQLVQFITPMSVFRPNGPFASAMSEPNEQAVTISGFKWHDLNQNGQWDWNDANADGMCTPDEGECGRAGWRIFIDNAGESLLGGNWQIGDTITVSRNGESINHLTQSTSIETIVSQLAAELNASTLSAISELQWSARGSSLLAVLNSSDLAPGFSITTNSVAGRVTDAPSQLNDNVFSVGEPITITNLNGRYVFTDLPQGLYVIREDRLGLSDGTFQVQSFPAGTDENVISVGAGESVRGDFGVAEAPNFGTFDYSPFIRPADEQLRRFRLLSAADQTLYRTAIMPWQSIDVVNNTNSRFNITGFDASTIAGPGDQLVSVVDANGTSINAAAGEPGVPVEPGATVTLYAFYDPQLRALDNDPDRVVSQFPEWLPGADPKGPHTFAPGDYLTIETDTPSIAFRVDVVGASTYDGDIFYDAAVDGLDVARLNDVLLDQNQHMPIVEGSTSSLVAFDPSSDINDRCPNGAEGVLNTCSWSLVGQPWREIALGDFGTLNTEWDRARAPFLDLDPDNSSASAGTGFSTEFDGSAGSIAIADSDAKFANATERILERLTVSIANSETGDKLEFVGTLPPGIELDTAASTDTHLEFTTTDVSVGGTLQDYNTVLSLLRYSASDSSPAGIRRIEIKALGKPAPAAGTSPNAPDGSFFTSGQLEGNVATTRVRVIRA